MSRVVLLASSGFVAGVWSASLFAFTQDKYFVGLILLISFSSYCLSKIEIENKVFYLRVSVLALFIALGLVRYLLTIPKVDLFKDQIGQKINLIGFVVEEPDERESKTYLTVEVTNPPADGEKILVSVPRYPKFNYGDEVELKGKLSQPENFATGANREFDYINYLAKDGIRYKLDFANAELLSSSHAVPRGALAEWGFKIVSSLIAVKNKFLASLYQAIPEPAASLGAGVTIGAKQGLGKEWSERFRIAGVSHIVVLSGYNITIVADTVAKLFSFLPRTGGFALGVISIILFTLMTGASSTAVRAAVMALIAILARAIGRVYDLSIALIVAGVLMVIWNPRILVFDFGFQLSFLATAGLIWLVPVIDKILTAHFRFAGPSNLAVRTGVKNKLVAVFRETLVSTLAAQLMVLPWLLYKMGNLSLVSLPVNLLILPLMPVTMLFSALTAGVGIVSPALAIIFAYPAYYLLTYMLVVIKLFAAIPFASVNVTYFPLLAVIGVYGVIIWIISVSWRKTQ